MLLRAQSFDSSTTAADYNSALVSVLRASVSIQAGGAFGANYLHSAGQYYEPMTFLQNFKPIPGGVSGYLGKRFRSTGQVCNIGIYDPSTQGHFALTITPTGQPVISRMKSAGFENLDAVLVTGAIGQVPTTGWCFLELCWSISATAGSVSLRVNGQEVIAVTGVRTQGVTSTDASSNAYNLFGFGDFQDIYVADNTGPAPGNTFFGDVRVYEATPTGAGTATDFAPTGAAANWQVAAQAAPAPATIFNSSTTVGATDLYTAAPIPTGLGVIFGVQVCSTMYKTDAGLRTASGAIKSGSTLAVGSGHSLQVTPVIYADVFTVDPATNVAFTNAGVNGLQFGAKILT